MRRGFGFLGLVVTAIVLVIVGVIAYNIGWSDGVATHLPANADGAPYYYGYGWHPWGGGFAFFGLLWFLLIVFGLFWLFRLAFFGGRRWSGGGPGWGYYRQGFDERMQEWHRRAHGEQPPSSGSTPPPPPTTA